jgi:hypothetical protein
MASSLNLDAELGSAASISARDADFPLRLFDCRLDDQPDHLVPERYLRNESREDSADRPLFVHPQYQFARNGRLPDRLEYLALWLGNFKMQEDMIWIKEAGSGADLPFWVGPELASITASMHAGNPAPNTLSREGQRVLAIAGVLVPSTYESIERTRWTTDPSLSHIGIASLLPIFNP